MPSTKKRTIQYQGFEQGPIRPPSEAQSLLIRVTRNCPWNRCSFCSVYKEARFSVRPVAHVMQDIDAVHRCVTSLRQGEHRLGRRSLGNLGAASDDAAPFDPVAYQAACHWSSGGMRSIFLQDANSLIVKPTDLIAILSHLKQCFPWVARITSYARSHTVARIKDADLAAICRAGLSRIHIGLESGSDAVLKRVSKGTTQVQHIKAGTKAKAAGMQLSEYVMPGLGGRVLSREHALETAHVLNEINPDFIRLRTLAVPTQVSLYTDLSEGRFEKCTDIEMAEEIFLFIESLNGITSMIKSDHILNLFQEIDGKLPEDKQKMVDVLQSFLDMVPERQVVYQVGRRLGIMSSLADMKSRHRLKKAREACERLGVTPDNADELIDELMRRFI